MRTLYLCGAINGCSDSQARDWREETKTRLEGQYACLDPMRRDYRGVEDQNYAEIVAGDLKDIQDSDVVLVAADRPSWGTAMEAFYAYYQGKQVVVICGQDRISPWLRFHATALVSTLDEAIGKLREWL